MDLIVVLFDADSWINRPGQFKNVRAYAVDGTEVWRCSLPSSTTNDHFVALIGGGLHEVSVLSFSGYRLRLDSATGSVLESEFVR